jgi:ABC-type dipeptide/oligopeptide/nickel transport system permease component
MARSAALRYYLLTRLLLAPLMIWTITTIVFLLMRASPGDPVDALLGARAPPPPPPPRISSVASWAWISPFGCNT